MIHALFLASMLLAAPGKDQVLELGSTGIRGRVSTSRTSTEAAREITIEAVPRECGLSPGDILCGVGDKRFDGDARRRLGEALAAAEEGDGRLTVLRRRGDAVDSVTLSVPTLGAWPALAPWNGAQGQSVLAQALTHIAQRDLKRPGVENSIAALALLSGGRAEDRGVVDAYAQRVAKRAPGPTHDMGMTAWEWGWAGIFLAEHHLSTRSGSSKQALRDYALAIARGQSGVGTWGHGMALQNESRSLGGYGALNQAGLGCWLALILAEHCGIQDPIIHAAIERSREFFRFYAGKGSIPYGDHPPYWDLHDNNGKNGQAAIAFALLGDVDAARFFARMTTAAHAERELGHTGYYLGMLWGLLGVNLAGPQAYAAHLAELRWLFALNRRGDGSFPYVDAPGEEDSYGGWDFTPVIALALSAPRQTLHITRIQAPLSPVEVEDTIAAGRGWSPARPREAYQDESTESLLGKLGTWSPVVRHRAAQALSRRGDDVGARLIAMLRSADMLQREGACQAIEMQGAKAAAATDALLELLRTDDPWLRIRAAYALAGIGEPARRAAPELLRLVNQDDPADSRALVRRYLALALFLDGHIDNGPQRGLLVRSVEGIDRELLFPAIERMLRLDDGLSRSQAANVYGALQGSEIEQILPAIRESVRVPAPSGEMFADGARLAGLELLARRQDPQGMRLALDYAANQNRWGSQDRMAVILKNLHAYGEAAKAHIPELERLAQACRDEQDFPEDCKQKKVAAVEAAIARIKGSRKVRVFLLAGQSNMEGPAVADVAPEWNAKDYNDGRGTLVDVLKDPANAARFAHLRNPDGTWARREDVRVSYLVSGKQPKEGPLTVGFSVHGTHHFGPELEIGHVLGDRYEEPVLLVKTAWGGKSLYADFRPPSSGGTTGAFYKRMLKQLRDAMAAVDGEAELCGVIWYQGWNDGCDPERAVREYEANLVNLIHDLRSEFKNPELPVVVGELTGPWVEAKGEWQELRDAQRRGAERAGAVFVPTHAFVRRAEDSPHPGHGHHEFGNAETYLLVGRALGEAMPGP